MGKSSNSTKNKKKNASGTGAPAKAAKTSPAEQKRAREEAKRKAEQEAARKRQIENQIAEKNNQIQSLNGSASALRAGRGRLAASIEEWRSHAARYRQKPVNEQIEVRDVFEGEAASGMSTRNRYYIAVMDTKVSRASAVQDRLAGQEQRLALRIGALNAEISGLRAQL